MRLGSTNRLADSAKIAEIRRLSENCSFDSLPDLQTKEVDLDWELAKSLFEAVNKPFSKQKAASLELLVPYQSRRLPSHGGLLLFGKEPLVSIRCGAFEGYDKVEILDQQDVTLPLPLALDPILAFIRRNTSMRAEIKEIRRKDIPQYPLTAVREALLNALIHADYAIPGSHTQVALFIDRLEITNPGSLLFGLRLEAALSGISQLRNRVIGRVFRELGLIEQWGSGLGRMQAACAAEGLPAPKFEEVDNFFRVTLYHRPERKRIVEEWQRPIVDYLRRHKELTVPDAEELWETSRRTARTRLKKMVEAGMLIELSTGPYDPRKSFILKSH